MTGTVLNCHLVKVVIAKTRFLFVLLFICVFRLEGRCDLTIMLKAILQAVPVPEGLGAWPAGAGVAGVPRLRLLAQRLGAAQGVPAVRSGLLAHPDQRPPPGEPATGVPPARAARALHVPCLCGGSGEAPRGAWSIPRAAISAAIPHSGATHPERRPV